MSLTRIELSFCTSAFDLLNEYLSILKYKYVYLHEIFILCPLKGNYLLVYGVIIIPWLNASTDHKEVKYICHNID